MEQVKRIAGQLEMLLGTLAPSRERAMVVRWKEEIDLYGERRKNREAVLAAISEDYDTMSEIISQTKIPRSTCYKILKRLLREGGINKTKVIRSGKNCSGGIYEFRYSIAPKDN